MTDRTAHLPAVDAGPDTDRPAAPRRRLRLPATGRRPAILLAAAAASAVLVPLVAAGQPDADAGTDTVSASVAVAEQLGLSTEAAAAGSAEASAATVPDLAPLEDIAASRSERDAAQASAAQIQAQADQAELDRQAAEKAAAEAAAREAEERAAAERAAAEAAEARAAVAPATQSSSSSGGSSSPAPQGSFKDYAMAKVGSAEQFGCLEKLWGKESGWNPNAQNPTSTAYGIAQFLDSTWAGTGIAKTSDGYRQIDAGLIYIQKRYSTPCGAWAHSQSTGWY